MRFDSTVGSIGIVSAILLAFSGCGGDILPVGGPFGGGLDPAAIVDGGIVSDGNGVLPSTFTVGASASPSGGVPTWTELYNTYFAPGTIGNCTSSSCHLPNIGGTASPSALYVWLEQQGQIGDDPPNLADPDFSCITWMSSDGTMPFGGPRVDSTATSDLKLWAGHGAKND